MIAIKLADGSYYPVLDELQQQAKRLVLVPATSDQKAIHIIFFQDNNIDFSQPQLIGKIELLNLPLTSDTEQNQNIYLTIDPRMDNVLKIHSTQGNQGAEQNFSFSFTVAENTAPDSPPRQKMRFFPFSSVHRKLKSKCRELRCCEMKC